MLGAGCGGQDAETIEPSDEAPASTASALTAPRPTSELRLVLPSHLAPDDVVLQAAGSLKISAKAQIGRGDGFSSTVVNTGPEVTELGQGTLSPEIWAHGPVELRARSRVAGNIRTSSTVSRGPGATVTGRVLRESATPALKTWVWRPELPAGSDTPVELAPESRQRLLPGRYGVLTVKPRAELTLGGGVYLFEAMRIANDATLLIDGRSGPSIVYVRGAVDFHGLVVDARERASSQVDLVLVGLGSGAVSVCGSFLGTLLAPYATVVVGPGQHQGAFFGQRLTVQPQTHIVHRGFAWPSLLQPRKTKNWSDAPVILHATLDHATGVSVDGEAAPAGPVTFQVPADLYVTQGSAGNGTVDLSFQPPSGPLVSCTYRSGSQTAHPTTDLERARALWYRFESCSSSRYTKDRTAEGSWFKVHIHGANRQDFARETRVDVHLGGGCSGTIPAPIPAEDVVRLRESFAWRRTTALPARDPYGNPALWHGLIYVENRKQLQALDRLRVFYSTQPISRGYHESLRGKCGRVAHAMDHRGVVVYALFPATLFNVMRNFGIEAETKGIAPPFRFFFPSTPDEPGLMNSDGSVSYRALAASRYRDWLAQRATQKPYWGEGFVDAVADGAKAVGGAVADGAEVVWDAFVEGSETGFSYVAKGFDATIDWTANALDDLWESIQEGLQEFVLLFEDSVAVRLDFRIVNRDPLFPAGSLMERAWGPPDASGGRPLLVPAGTQVRVRQWGFGFLPVMDEAELKRNGHVELEAIEDAKGRGGDLCIELDSDDAMITTDLIPNEVCGFDDANLGDFAADVNDTVVANQEDLFALTQILDGADYDRTVLEHEPYKADVLTGWLANEFTSILNGKERAMCLCLDFPSVGAGAITVASGLVGAGAGAAAGAPFGGAAIGAAIGAFVGIVGASLIEKDIFWPDAGANVDSTKSRGVMTHEYGHFTMCSLLFEEDGASGLTGLIARMFEEIDTPDPRKREIGLMTEAIADVYALQVVGGVNYIAPAGSLSGTNMAFCVQSPCLDFNYEGTGDYRRNPGEQFHDELARYESLIHDAFDRADSNNWFANQPGNGDVWRDQGGSLVFSSSPFIGNDDEPVSLPGRAWKTWIERWLDRGQKPTVSNVIGGLVSTMKDEGWTWCDRCEVLAPHYDTTPDWARLPDPSLASAIRSFQVRWQRWASCTQDAAMKKLLGKPPDADLTLDATCTPCPSRYFTDSGTCRPCGAGEVARVDHCDACPPGTVPTDQDTCSPCGADEISDGDFCSTCPFGMGKEPGTNGCVSCPADAVIDWNNIAKGCFEAETVAVVAGAGPGDVCPSQFWLEVNGLGVVAARGGEGLVASLSPASDPTSRQSCERLRGQITAAEDNASGGWVAVAEVTHRGSWATGSGTCEPWEPASVALAQLAPGTDSLRLFAFAVEVWELPVLGQVSVLPIAAWLYVGSSANYPECIIE